MVVSNEKRHGDKTMDAEERRKKMEKQHKLKAEEMEKRKKMLKDFHDEFNRKEL